MKPFFLTPSEDLVNTLEVDNSTRLPDVYEQIVPGKITQVAHADNHFTFICDNDVKLRVYFIREDIIRFRYVHEFDFGRDFTYTIDRTFKATPPHVSFTENEQEFTLSCGHLEVKIQKIGATIAVQDSNQVPILEDANGFYAYKTIMNGLVEIGTQFKTSLNETFYGLGEKTNPFNLKGTIATNYCTDAFAYGKHSDELYRSIPFYIGLNSGHGYGVFLDNSYKSRFDFDSEREDTVQIAATGGELNYYFIDGPSLVSVVRKYAALTGKAPLPPMWALGYHQCRWSYFPEARVRELAKDFRDKEIPCDAIYFDIDYMEEYKIFTWDKGYFPDPKTLIHDLKKDGFSSVVMIDPGVSVEKGYHVYETGMEEDVYCRRPNGDFMTGPVWPQKCVWPDYTSEKTRKWWGELYRPFYEDLEIDGFWNDMNEPAVFKIDEKTFSEHVLHDFEGEKTSHAQIHNVYGQQMSRATFEGLKGIKPSKRPFVLTRATCSGGQRYAALWTGDNVSSWEHLHLANLQMQRLAVSGFSLTGSDIGGFAGYPDGELLTRWVQLGVFHPVFRVHSMGKKTDGAAEVDETIKLQEIKLTAEEREDQEPWSFGEPYTSAMREAIELRYQLLPYIYTIIKEHADTGEPVLKNLIFVDQQDAACMRQENEFVFGKHLLVSPVSNPNVKGKTLYLPKGDWYNYWTREKISGQKKVFVETSLTTFPFFIAQGTVLPQYPVRQHTKEKIDALYLKIFKGNNTTELYLDDGESFEFENGKFLKTTFNQEVTKGLTTITTVTEGAFKPQYDKIIFEFIGFESISSVTIDGKPVKIEDTDTRPSLTFKGTSFESILIKS